MNVSTLLLNFPLALHHCLSSYCCIVIHICLSKSGYLTIWLIQISNILHYISAFDILWWYKHPHCKVYSCLLVVLYHPIAKQPGAAIHIQSSLHTLNYLVPNCTAGNALVSDQWQNQAGSFFPPAVELFRPGFPLGRFLLCLPDRYNKLSALQGSSGSSQNSQQRGYVL